MGKADDSDLIHKRLFLLSKSPFCQRWEQYLAVCRLECLLCDRKLRYTRIGWVCAWCSDLNNYCIYYFTVIQSNDLSFWFPTFLFTCGLFWICFLALGRQKSSSLQGRASSRRDTNLQAFCEATISTKVLLNRGWNQSTAGQRLCGWSTESFWIDFTEPWTAQRYLWFIYGTFTSPKLTGYLYKPNTRFASHGKWYIFQTGRWLQIVVEKCWSSGL
jgi:hypothetical protein